MYVLFSISGMSLENFNTLIIVAATTLSIVSTLGIILGAPSRNLRKGLANDTSILTELKGSVQDELRANITARTYKLLAHQKYPYLKPFDGLLMATIVVCLLWLLLAPEELQELRSLGESSLELSGLGQSLFTMITLILLSILLRTVGGRAANRILYLYDNVSDEEAGHTARMLFFPLVIIPFLVLISLAGLLVYNWAAIYMAYDLHDSFPVITILLSMLVIGLFGSRLYKKNYVHRFISFYFRQEIDPKDPTNLRPIELGRTAEADDRYWSYLKERAPRQYRYELKRYEKLQAAQRHNEDESPNA